MRHLSLSLGLLAVVSLPCLAAAAPGWRPVAKAAAAVYRPITLQDALAQQPDPDAWLLIVGTTRPQQRRQPTTQTPVLRFAPAAADQLPAPIQQLLSQCMQGLAGRSRLGLELDVLPAGARWAAVFDVSAGRVLVSQQFLRALNSTPVHAVSTATQAATVAMQHVLHLAGQALPGDLEQLFTLARTAAGVGIAAAFVAAVPQWFCFVCPIVLGLLAPLVINAGLGEAAELACKTLQLPDDECVDLWFAALGLGMVLSLLAALPIVKVCRLYECAHPGPPIGTPAAVAAA